MHKSDVILFFADPVENASDGITTVSAAVGSGKTAIGKF